MRVGNSRAFWGFFTHPSARREELLTCGERLLQQPFIERLLCARPGLGARVNQRHHPRACVCVCVSVCLCGGGCSILQMRILRDKRGQGLAHRAAHFDPGSQVLAGPAACSPSPWGLAGGGGGTGCRPPKRVCSPGPPHPPRPRAPRVPRPRDPARKVPRTPAPGRGGANKRPFLRAAPRQLAPGPRGRGRSRAGGRGGAARVAKVTRARGRRAAAAAP